MGNCHSTSFKCLGVLTWVPLETIELGTVLVLDTKRCTANSLKSASYIHQSSSYIFRPDKGVIGRCWYSKGTEFLRIHRTTRFDEFHRAGTALENEIRCIFATYDEELNEVKEYLNTDRKYENEDKLCSVCK